MAVWIETHMNHWCLGRIEVIQAIHSRLLKSPHLRKGVLAAAAIRGRGGLARDKNKLEHCFNVFA